MGNWLTDINPITAFKDLTGGGGHKGPPAPKWNPQDQIQQFLGQYNVNQSTTPSNVLNFLQTTEPDKIKKSSDLSTVLQGLAGTNQWTPKYQSSNPAENAGNYAQVLDPLAVQQFWQQSVAPFMQQLGQQEQQTAEQMRTQDTSGLPPGYAKIMQVSNQQGANDMSMLQQATSGAAMTQPRLNDIETMLGAVQKAQLNNYYEALRYGVTSGAYQLGLSGP